MQSLLLAGRYRLGESIGRGGMGRVWRAHDEVLHRTVAVKELTAAQYAPDNDRRILLARTQTEARAAARINHPAVVTIHDVLEHDDRPWIVMELVEGSSLADVVRDSGALDATYAARVGLWVLRALRAAHAAGVLHRDVKPANVLLADDGRVLLTDFGIAYMEGDTTLTKTGEIVGSVEYLAPERVHGADPGPACDLWALGATLYTAVEGSSPFRRGTPLATMQAVVDEEPPVPSAAGPLGPVIAALLHKDPASRPTAAAAEAMLADAAEGRWPAPNPDDQTTRVHHYEAPSYENTPPTAHQPPPPAPHGATATHPAVGHGPGPYGGQYDAHGPAGTPVPGFGHDTAVPQPGEHRPATRGRRGWTVAAATVAAAALVGGGTFFGLQYAKGSDNSETPSDPPRSASQSSSPSSSPTSSPTGRPGGTVPAGWKQVNDPAGFSLAVPKGWQRKVDGSQIDYTPDQGKHFVRISIDRSPDYANAYAHQVDLEKALERLPDYRRVALNANIFRDQTGSLWEFTWTARSDQDDFPGPRHAIEQTYYDRDGVEYAIYVSSPEPGWAKAHQQFKVMLRNWQPPPA
jgi:serine/threonine protein kinase